jgi:glyoxylate reductase
MTKENQAKKILITRDIPEVGIDMLKREGFSLTVWQNERPMTNQELIESAMINNALLTVSADKIDADFLNRCKHLEIISQFAAGYDNINIQEATRQGIPIGYTPNAMSEATADIAFGLMIAVSRKMFYLHKTIAKGEWGYFRPKANLGIELRGKMLGVFGLGRIGMAMAKRCKGAYEMDIIYHNRKPNKKAEEQLGARWVKFEELLSQSDVLSVHSMFNTETMGVFNKDSFSKMKPTAIFINTSRGGVHNELDLIDALRTGKIWGAGLDVTNPEPMAPDNPLLSMENVAILPHIGSSTIEARNEMSRSAALNIIEFYRNNHVPFILNPEALKLRT